jgi:hypothetical protein
MPRHDHKAGAIVELRKRGILPSIILPKEDTLYSKFRKQYFNDWTAFGHDCIKWQDGEGLTPYQEEVLSNLTTKKRVAIRGPHGMGKSFIASVALLAFVLTRDIDYDWKCPTTASAWRQVKQFLWPEIHKWVKRLDWEKIGREPFNKNELLTLNLNLETGQAFGFSADDYNTIEGAHARQLFYIFDEAKTIDDNTFDAAEGAFSGAGSDTGNEAFALAISTPGEPLGRFYDIHSRKPGYEDWWVKHVTLEEAIKAKRISKEWAEQRRLQWGETSAVYQNRVKGEFAASQSDSVIPLSWIELANDRWMEWQQTRTEHKEYLYSLGVDVGGGMEGSDKSVIAENYDRFKIDALRKFAKGDEDKATMELAGRVKGILDYAEFELKESLQYKQLKTEDDKADYLKQNRPRAILDAIGIGLGVYNRLREQGYKNVLAFIAGASATVTEGQRKVPVRDKTKEFIFADKRSAMWWLSRELLDPQSSLEVCLPIDDELIGELTAPKYSVESGAKIKVESKIDIRKRLKRSTDSADAVLQALSGKYLCEEPEGVFFG